jgi:TRAP-type mannitol/chloroaromatic compound transport system permease small subunit
MRLLLRLSHLIDAFNERVGRLLIWLILAAVLISAGNAIVRKTVSFSSNAFLEAQWYLYSAVFLLGAGYAFLRNVHVRIDVVSARLPARTRSWIDVAGIVAFLLPMCALLLYLSWPLFYRAWESGEMSQSAGGLIRWPVWLMMPLGMALLLAQALSELIKRIAFLRGLIADPIPLGGHASEAGAPPPQGERADA